MQDAFRTVESAVVALHVIVYNVYHAFKKLQVAFAQTAVLFGQYPGHKMPIEHLADRSEAARYCAQICRELRDLASNNELTFLAYLLEMARVEAFDKHADLEQGAFDRDPS
ncbi:hypothetical protein [Stappia sp.]|uniref:hypothetical protein n=1 Tax=Stappia sp. TaxID=1870903 RepID=UPI003A99F5EB